MGGIRARVALLVVAALVAVAAPTWTATGLRPDAVRTFRSHLISFRYPAWWTVREVWRNSFFGSGNAKFSSQGYDFTCLGRRCSLPRGGSLASGQAFGWVQVLIDPRSRDDTPPGRSITVDGREGRYEFQRADSDCRAAGGEQQLVALIQFRHDWTTSLDLSACISEPVGSVGAELLAMVSTLRVLEPTG